MNILSSMVFVPNLLFFFFKASFCTDSITQTQSLTDGNTLVSRGGNFELGFFSPGSSKNRYLGIWYKNIPVKTVVWVANRSRPINDSYGILMINNTGSLLLLSQNKTVVWSASSSKQSQEPLLQLLDSGNLVLTDEKNVNSEDYLWQSFDYPSDTFLPGMKQGWDLRRGLNRHVTAWKNWDDPSPGDFIFKMELHSYPEAIMWKGTEKYCRSGPWNGVGFGGSPVPEIKQNSPFGFKFVNDEDEVYYSFYLENTSVIIRIVLNQSSYLSERSTWSDAERNWKLYSSVPWDSCDHYNVCGAYGNCILSEFPRCHCLKGFKPKSQGQWESMDWSQGCVRNKPLSCQDGHEHGFLKFVGLKIPDTTQSWVDRSMNLNECRAKCLNNCSCMAYTSTDVTGKGSGCALWFGDLLDMKKFDNGEQPLYIRMDASELGMSLTFCRKLTLNK